MSLADSKTTNKGGDFLVHEPATYFIPEEFQPDEKLMAETAYQFCKKEVLPIAEKLEKVEDDLMPSLVKKACELGFGGPDTPEKYGGLGLGKALSVRILEMLSLNGSFSTTIGVQQGVGQTPLVLFGNEEQKQKYLPLITSGEWMTAYALSEPNSGSDALSISTKAILQDSHYHLEGTKMWISNAKWANLFITFAKIDGDKFSCFLIERDFPGVSISREEHKMGLKGSSTARLILEDAKVPDVNLLYKAGEGHRVAFNGLNIGRCKLAGMALGQCRESIHQAVKYAKERKQFNQPISNFGLIKDKLSRMGAFMFAAESILYRTAGLLDEAFSAVNYDSENLPEENRKASEEFQIECSIVKVFATDVLGYCVDESLQIHGGYGFTEEFPVARMYRDARVMRIYEGTNEINRLFIFDRVIRKGLDALVNKELTIASNYISQLAPFAVKAMEDKARYDLQQITGAMSDLIITHYAIHSSQLRAGRLKNMGHPKAGFARSCADFFSSFAASYAHMRAVELSQRLGVPLTAPGGNGGYKSDADIADTLLESDGYPLT